MKVIYGWQENNRFNKPTGVGLGNFDGLHIGHMALINTLISESTLDYLDSIVYTFSKHPENIIRKKLFTPLITTVNKKVELLGQTRLDYLYFDEFDETYSRIKPEVFVEDILVKRLNMKLAVAGVDYRFGYKGQGDVSLLTELGKEHNFRVVIIPPIKSGNDVVSSTLIRKYIAKGDMDKVFNLLGRHYSITGKVEKGRRVGNTLGFPTANIYPESYLVLPDRGVYISKTLIGGRLYNSLTNIGNNPTFTDCKNISVETHILDFEEDIYGSSIEVFFIFKIREEEKFDSVNELIIQMEKDVLKAREYFKLR
ncbi:MAG: bifunctional riboflavin kinase/FAD synthetase [Bacillota bacterium]